MQYYKDLNLTEALTGVFYKLLYNQEVNIATFIIVKTLILINCSSR